MSEEPLGESFLSVLGEAGGRDLLADAAEFSLDSLLADGPIKDIPIVGAVARLFGMARGAQGYIFSRKIQRFLVELRAVPMAERQQFLERLEQSTDLREQVATAVLTFLDKLDDLEKAPLLARAFKHFLRQEYDLTTLRRFAVAIDRCLVADLQWLSHAKKGQDLPSHIGDLFVSAGLASIKGIPTVRAEGTTNIYATSQLGEQFRHYVVRDRGRDEL